MEMSQNQKKASGEIVDLILNVTGKNKKLHSATAIATSARLSGLFIFRSIGLNIADEKPGTIVLSGEANEGGGELINVIGFILSDIVLDIDNNKLELAEIPKAQINFIESLNLTQTKAIEIMRKYKLTEREMSVACAVSTALIIQKCQNDLDVETGFITALYELIRGSKTVPSKLNGPTTRLKNGINLEI